MLASEHHIPPHILFKEYTRQQAESYIAAIARRHKRSAAAMEKTMGGSESKPVPSQKPTHPDDPPDAFSGNYDIHELVEKKRFDKLRILFGSNLIIG